MSNVKLSKGSATKDRIIEAALSLFSHKNFFEVSFQDIADKSQIAQTTVLYHFKSKDELFMGVLQKVLENNRNYRGTTHSARDNAYERIYKDFKGHLDWCEKNPTEGKVIILFYYLSSYNQQFNSIYVDLIKRSHDKFSDHLYAGIREKIFNISEADVDHLTESLHDLYVGGLIKFDIMNSTLKRQDKLSKVILTKWDKTIRVLVGYKKNK